MISAWSFLGIYNNGTLAVTSEERKIRIFFFNSPSTQRCPATKAEADQLRRKLDTLLPLVHGLENYNVEHSRIGAFVTLLSQDHPCCVLQPLASPCLRISVEAKVG